MHYFNHKVLVALRTRFHQLKNSLSSVVMVKSHERVRDIMKKLILCLMLLSTSVQAETFNFRVSPIHLVTAFINLNLDVTIMPNWTLGPTYGYWTYKSKSLASRTSNTSYDVKYMTFGARTNWFLNGVYKSGLYVGSFLNFVNAKVAVSGSVLGIGETTSNNLGVMAGYGWYGTSFNQMVGAGLSTNLGNTRVSVVDAAGSSIDEVEGSNFSGFAVEYTVGWTF
jgi:hypothetical protein